MAAFLRIRRKLVSISSALLSGFAGIASFLFTLGALLLLRDIDQQIAAALVMGLFALLVVWVASEKPNSSHAQAVSALIDRLLAVGTGDLSSPAPEPVRECMPALAAAVDNLFEQVRSNLDNVHAMALYDPVTSLPNRVHFKREADRILKARPRDDTTALLFIDLDGFKEVNDNLGHAHGDQVLAVVADRLRAVVRDEAVAGVAQPLIARLAGDEFTLLFPQIRGSGEAEQIAQSALAALGEPVAIAAQTIHMGASIGIALGPDHGADLPALMKSADIAMYHAKASGRSRVCLFDASMAAAFEHKSRTEQALRAALAREEFSLAFQPQISVRTGDVVAGEALLRWHHPSEAVHLPEGFIRIAEETSLIVDIGDWVIAGAAAAIARWHRVGLNTRLTVNVSPRQVERGDFFERLRAAMEGAGAPFAMLEIEFTETVAMQCGDAMVAELNALRERGASIAIDDFGAGYSNLVRLRDLPIDRVKLDQSLIADIDVSASARTIVAAVIHLVHGLGCGAVAEGVERIEQLDVLRTIGCDTVQGFAFAEAMAEDDFLAWIAERGVKAPVVLTA